MRFEFYKKHSPSAVKTGAVRTGPVKTGYGICSAAWRSLCALTLTASLYLSVIVSSSFSTYVIADDIFKQLIDMRHGAELFHKGRFSDAEVFFEELYALQKDEEPIKLVRLSTTINFLAQSKSFIGKSEEALQLMSERLVIAEKIYGKTSPELGPFQSGLAEAYFRNFRADDALEMVKLAVDSMAKLGEEHAQHLALATANIERYQTTTYDPTNLPADLSEFYNFCESIISGDTEFAVDKKMDKFVELNVDFNPTGYWGSLFEIAANGRDGDARSGENYRRIFLPTQDESMRSDVCVVDQKSGVVISADNDLE